MTVDVDVMIAPQVSTKSVDGTAKRMRMTMMTPTKLDGKIRIAGDKEEHSE